MAHQSDPFQTPAVLPVAHQEGHVDDWALLNRLLASVEACETALLLAHGR